MAWNPLRHLSPLSEHPSASQSLSPAISDASLSFLESSVRLDKIKDAHYGAWKLLHSFFKHLSHGGKINLVSDILNSQDDDQLVQLANHLLDAILKPCMLSTYLCLRSCSPTYKVSLYSFTGGWTCPAAVDYTTQRRRARRHQHGHVDHRGIDESRADKAAKRLSHPGRLPMHLHWHVGHYELHGRNCAATSPSNMGQFGVRAYHSIRVRLVRRHRFRAD